MADSTEFPGRFGESVSCFLAPEVLLRRVVIPYLSWSALGRRMHSPFCKSQASYLLWLTVGVKGKKGGEAISIGINLINKTVHFIWNILRGLKLSMVNEVIFVSDYMDVFSCVMELGNPFFFSTAMLS